MPTLPKKRIAWKPGETKAETVARLKHNRKLDKYDSGMTRRKNNAMKRASSPEDAVKRANAIRKRIRFQNKTPAKRQLTQQQSDLVRFYFTDAKMNRRQALIMAGYSPKNYKAFETPAVVKEMERWRKEIVKVDHQVYENVIEELQRVAFFNLAEVLDFDEDTGEYTGDIVLNKDNLRALSAVGEVQIDTKYVGGQKVTTVKVKPWNKLTALEQLIKHSGQSREKKDVNVNVSIEDHLAAGRNRVASGPVVDAEFEEVD